MLNCSTSSDISDVPAHYTTQEAGVWWQKAGHVIKWVILIWDCNQVKLILCAVAVKGFVLISAFLCALYLCSLSVFPVMDLALLPLTLKWGESSFLLSVCLEGECDVLCAPEMWGMFRDLQDWNLNFKPLGRGTLHSAHQGSKSPWLPASSSKMVLQTPRFPTVK